ncbi:mitochondrial inner membrane protein OXA1L isoform X2 [Ixodes scapularis]|uniref:mitochondrial inner membrane protein OXA1L isoform X2 n=1 Tax=Ixodes scapularis TaxID=6945 RepID=UPI0011618783|nr:mitochondrial inner membrane protein OXA1L isoform X2 [Ixodes scapularis]
MALKLHGRRDLTCASPSVDRPFSAKSSCRVLVVNPRNGKFSHCCSVGPLAVQRRWSSGTDPGTASVQATLVEAVPPVPAAPVPAAPVLEVVDPGALVEHGEGTLQSMGLGGWAPSGMVQHCLDLLHSSTGLPWWATIALGTVVVKLLVFPAILKGQKNTIHMNNHLPQMQVLQAKLSEARSCGNQMEAARYANELMLFMKEKQINPLKNMIIPMVQAPVFISFFFALRGMANLPMESFKTGGMLWFTDLTIPDPYCLLPLITSATLFFTIELGAESGVRADNLQWTRYVFRAMPIVIFPFTMNFPAALLCYWATSNMFTLAQVGLLRVGAVREALNMPTLVKHKKSDLVLSKKSFMEGVKDSFTNARITRELEDRVRADEMQFKRAGMGPVVKTYPYNPTKQAFAKGAQDGRKIND